MRNLHINQQSAMILPQAFDPDTRQPLFQLELLSLNGSKAMDTTKIKEYYKNMILMSMFSDVLAMGQGSGGSFALGQIKNSLSGWFVESMLKKIVQVINDDLIRQTYELNNWDTSRLGTMDFDNLQPESLDELGKFFQRVASTSLIEVDREVLNAVRNAVGVDPMPDDLPPQEDLLPGYASRAGDGMSKGSGNGTSDSVASTDTSSLNVDNAA